jgi:hypothetical protein
LTLSRLNHWLPKGEDAPEIMQGTEDVAHPIAAAHLPEAASVFDAATALDTATDMVDPQPTLVELLVSHVLLPREFLPQIGINSLVYPEGLPIQMDPLSIPSYSFHGAHMECTTLFSGLLQLWAVLDGPLWASMTCSALPVRRP